MIYGKENVDIDNTEWKTSEMAELKDIKEQLMLYVKENQRLVNELRELRHDKINIIHGINGYIELENWDGLKKYFSKLLKETRSLSDTSLSSIEKILNPSLKELLYSKFKSAIITGIDAKVMVDDSILIENSRISETDLCKVIGEFLDNAIEAASRAAIRKVSIYILNSNESVSIIIESTFKEKPSTPLKKAIVTGADGEKPGAQPAAIVLSNHPEILNNTFIQHQVFVQELQILK